ncbi:DUF1254 domain-containing protein [Phenylobacterium sp.]|uniref:DUF1254 domain-containing protein n=1 Tax=Phenylobacterium sp. TaxID=1871053 RepID=UPI0025F25A24|nr:DUF1254 domain-containing protein [Phenylobacterium sp.]
MTVTFRSRRAALLQIAAMGAIALAAGGARGAPTAPIELKQAAAEAWLYGLPLIEAAANRAQLLSSVGANRLLHHRKLATPADRWVTSPNNDTIYSNAWINLARGPVTIDLPAIGERYASFAFMDATGRNFTVLGSRTTGPAARRVTLVGPGQATTDPFAVRAPSVWVWFLARFLTTGPDDLPAVWRLQDRLRISGGAAAPDHAHAANDAPWPDYFASVQALLKENPPPLVDAAFFQRISALGLGVTGGFDAARFDAGARREIEAGVTEARAAARAPWRGQTVDGWLYPDLRPGGPDLLRRAQVAMNGIGGLPPEEALYLRGVDAQGRNAIAADKSWRLHFPAGGLPPVDGFWSLSMYEVAADSKRYFAENPIDRYSIGDRTPGLRTNPDGSLDIWLSRADPGGPRTANWLPLPAGPAGSLTFRAYLPQARFLKGDYRLPPILPAAAA